MPVTDDVPVPIHNVLPLADGTVVTLDTGAGELRTLGADGTAHGSWTVAPPAPYGFLRGLCPTGDGLLLIGERNRLLLVDLSVACLIRELTLSPSPREAVYAIAPLPAGFQSLPARLSAG